MADPGATGETDEERTTIGTGRDFEENDRLDANEAGEFLVDPCEQLRDDDEPTIVTDEWELPFAFGGSVGLEIGFGGVGDSRLEIESELPGRTDAKAPDIE